MSSKTGDVRFRSLMEMTTLGGRISRLQQSRMDATIVSDEATRQTRDTFDWQGFSDEAMEGMFIVSLMQNWYLRIGLSGFLGITMVITLFQYFDPLGLILFVLAGVFWCLGAILLSALRGSAWLALRHKKHSAQNSSSPLIMIGNAPALLVRHAKAAELVTVILLYGGNVFFTMGNVVNRRTCKTSTNGQRWECLDRDGFNMNEIIVYVFICLMTPVRFPWVVVVAAVHLVAFTLTFAWIALDSRLEMYSNTMLLTTMLVACTMMVYFRESQHRRTLIMRLKQEEAMKQTQEVRRLAVQTAARHIPDHVVKSLSVFGTYSTSGEGIVVGFALANFSHWCAGRGPRDVVHAVASLVEAYTEGMTSLFSDERLLPLQLPKFGGMVMFAFFGKPNASVKDCADRVFLATIATVKSAEDACRRCCDASNTMLTPASSTEHERSPWKKKGVVCDIHPLCAVAMGGVDAWYDATISSLLATGSAVDECTTALQQLSDVLQTQPRIHISDSVAVQRVHFIHHDASLDMRDEAKRNGKLPAPEPASFVKGSNESSLTTAVASSNPLALPEASAMPMFPPGDVPPTTRDGRGGQGTKTDGATLQDEFRMEGFVPRFVVAETENAFSEHQLHSFDVRAMTSNAVAMLATGIAMLFVCILYDQRWELRSPLPYVIGCCVAALVLLGCALHPVLRTYVFVLNTCYWVFCFSCIASSALPPQFSSIFGYSLFPWCLISATVALQRPLWYHPFAMCLLEQCLCLYVLLDVLLPLRRYSAIVVGIAVRMVVPAGFFDVILRILMDRQERTHFRWTKLLAATIAMHKKESSNLIQFLDGFMPSRVAKQILKHQLVHGAAMAWIHMSHRSALMTAVEDQPFAMVQWLPPPSIVVGLPLGMSSSRISATLLRLAESIRVFNTEHLAFATDTRSTTVRMVKADGDVAMLTADLDQLGNFTDSIGSGCAKLVDAVHHIQSTLGIGAEGTQVRGIVGACPTIGAVLGNHAPSFEWFAPELLAALRVLRMSDDYSGPAFPGRIVCTCRARYHIQRLLEDEKKSEAGSSHHTRYSFYQRLSIKVCGVPPQDMSMVEVSARRYHTLE